MPIKKENKHKYPKDWKTISKEDFMIKQETFFVIECDKCKERFDGIGQGGFSVHDTYEDAKDQAENCTDEWYFLLDKEVGVEKCYCPNCKSEFMEDEDE